MRILMISVITENLYMTVLPLGPAYVAAAARDAGHEARMLNLSMGRDNFREILEKEIKGFDPAVIGISLRNVDDQTMKETIFLLPPVKEVIDLCRVFSDSPVVIGGAGYSIFPKSALAYTGADMGIQGEGEAAFVMLLDRLEKKQKPSDVPGLYLAGEGLQAKPVFPKTLDCYAMPLPNDPLTLPVAPPDQPIWLPIQSRRGCPMDCSYCSTASIEGRRLRKHSPRKVVENVRRYVEAGINHFFFVDNTFNFPPAYAEELCDRLIAEKLTIRSRCIIYPSHVEQGLVKKMAKAGFKEVSLGFETGSETMLKNFNKRFSIHDVKRISQIFKNENIFRMGFLLLGGPGETRETVFQSLRFVDDLNLDMVKVSVGIRVYPHTRLADMAIAEGKILSHENLLFPAFYVVEQLKDWLYDQVGQWAKDRPNWII